MASKSKTTAAKKTDSKLAVPQSDEKRDGFGCRLSSGGHAVCAALVKLSGAKREPVQFSRLILESAKLAGDGNVREFPGIINALRVGGITVRTGRGTIQLTERGAKLWKTSSSVGTAKLVNGLRDADRAAAAKKSKRK